MKKILHISKYYYPFSGGTEQIARDVVLALKGEYEQKVIAFNDGKEDKLDIVDGIEVTKCGCFTKIAAQSLSVSYGKHLHKVMKEFNPDIVVFHYPNPFVTALLLRELKNTKAKLVVYWHLDIVRQKYLKLLFAPQNRSLLARADKVIATSPNYIEGSKWLQSVKEKCIVVPNCINVERMTITPEIEKRAAEIRKENKDKTIYNPTSGTKHESASTSGSTTYAGVYTIPLNDDVELKPGTTFSVVVTLDRAVMDCEQATAIQKEEDFGTDKYVWMRQVSLYNYKSFYQSGSGFTPNIQNYCIKAYTSDGAKTEENSENLQGYTLTLDGSIGVNFYMDLSNEFAADDAYMEFSLPNGDTQQIKVSEAKKKDDSYVFTCKVAAKEMTADIQAQMVAGDVRGEMYTYNVKQYADYILAHTDAYSGSAVALVKSMLNYGAAAQQLFSYRTDTPANADLNEEDKVIDSADFSNYQYTVTQEDQVTGVQYYGSVLSLKSEICMKNYFLIDAGKSVDDYVFSIGSETGGKVILEPQEARINGKTCYYVTVKDIKAYDMDQNMTITVCENNQNETGLELHYGIFSYADAVSKLQNPDEKLVTVTKALYQYWEDAKQYQAEVNG